ncbi:hypothetical protein [Calidifontibacter terrae]
MPEVFSVVITADQIGSRRHGDKVPTALDQVNALPRGRGGREFARTAGDEIQGLVTDSEAAIAVIEVLIRSGDWRIGVGIGEVETPTPRDVRAATGPAFVRARAALTAARGAPGDLGVIGPGSSAQPAQAALWLLAVIWRRRTGAGWEVVAAAERGGQQQQIAQELGITPSAVSQRLRSASYAEGVAGIRLAIDLLDRARRAGDVVGVAG